MERAGNGAVQPGAAGGREWFGQLRVLRQVNRYEFAVEIDIMRDGVNRNGWEYRNLQEQYKSFAGTPILVAYVGAQVGDGHNSEEAFDPETGQRYRSYMGATAERIVGMVSEDEGDIALLAQGGHTWIRAKGRIWSVYAPEVAEKIVRTGRMEVSAETNVLEEHREGNVDVFTRWEGLGVTILGEAVEPAIPGANIRALAAMEQKFKQMKLRVASLRQEENQPQEDKEKNKGVKQGMMANKTLAKELAAKFPDYRVLSFTDDGMCVCLLNEQTGETFSYAFVETDKGMVVNERLRPVSLNAVLSFEGRELSVSFDQVMEEYTSRIATLSAALEMSRSECEAAKKRADDADARENKRRIKASKQAAENQLMEINRNRAAGEQIENGLIDSILQAAEEGRFTANCDENGDWCGDETARGLVRDIAMKRQMELDRERAEAARSAKEKRYAFENGYNGAGGDDSLAGLYARVMG